ncbi:MAG: Hpt domain-containing protein [Pseudomonadota bacterium]
MTNPIIDTAALLKLKDMIGGDTEDLAELVDDFVAAFPDQAARMMREAAAEDWGALRITAHSCKSNARDMGARTLSELCATLELQCKSGAPTGAAQQVSGIEAAGAEAVAALKGLDLENV